MHISHILPLSLSLVSSALAQALAGNQAAPKPQAISINVGGQNAAGQQPQQPQQPGAAPAGKPQAVSINVGGQQPGVAPTPVGQQPQQPAVAGAAPAAITINPGGPGNQGQAGAAIPQQPQGLAPGQAPVPGQQSRGAVPVWVIKVGSEKNDLVFSPNTFNAMPGEFVQFQFYSRNHSVVSSTFEQPCTPNSNVAPQNSFFSGFMPTDQQGQITYTIPIRDTNPIWFYCSQGRHCQDGMVGVINPPQNGQQTLQQYQQNAQRATDNISPNAPPPGVQQGGQGGTQTGPGIAQATRSAGTILRKASWELVGAAAVVWAML